MSSSSMLPTTSMACLPTAIDSYLRLDSQLIWQPWKGLELALVGQNLLQSKHEEFAPVARFAAK